MDQHFSVILLLVITYLWGCSEAVLQCYKCTSSKPPLYSNETVRLCADFDYSTLFIVDCPSSTYCSKRSLSARIPELVNLTERDCAHQKHTTHTFKNGNWQQEEIIEEPYREGCTVVDDKGVRTSTTVDCYCHSSLCNGAHAYYYYYYYSVYLSVVVAAVILKIMN